MSSARRRRCIISLSQVEAADVEIKRDMEVETEGVRVLTVHASKGLEAPIVFCPTPAAVRTRGTNPLNVTVTVTDASANVTEAWTVVGVSA